MDGEKVSGPLPDDLVERILAVVPFPYVFKARVLSKSWLARFSSIPSAKGNKDRKPSLGAAARRKEEKKQLAISFQKQMGELWWKWNTFSPAFVDRNHLLAYDRESRNWLTIPALCFLPNNHRAKSQRTLLFEDLEGALLLVSTFWGHHTFTVANILTRSWKKLPPRPYAGSMKDVVNFVSHPSSEGYKLIGFYTVDGHCHAQIYDSKSGAWSIKRLDLPQGFKVLSNNVYLDGVRYWVVGPNEVNRGLMALNVKEETFELLQMPFTDIAAQGIRNPRVCLVVCNANVLMVIYDRFFADPFDSLIVVKIGLGLQRWVEVTRGPPASLNFRIVRHPPVSDGDSIFFKGAGSSNDCSVLLSYHVEKDEWSYLRQPVIDGDNDYYIPACLHSFQPGLNPFVTV